LWTKPSCLVELTLFRQRAITMLDTEIFLKTSCSEKCLSE